MDKSLISGGHAVAGNQTRNGARWGSAMIGTESESVCRHLVRHEVEWLDRKLTSAQLIFTLLLLVFVPVVNGQGSTNRPRARDIGLVVGTLPTGKLNAITDVPGVLVGQATLIEGDSVRTGVTVVLPHAGNLFLNKVAGAVFVGNGFGKIAGTTQVNELGEIETPIALTSTLNVPRVADAIIDYMLNLPGNEGMLSINPLVAETNDGILNDIRGRHVDLTKYFARLLKRGVARSKKEQLELVQERWPSALKAVLDLHLGLWGHTLSVCWFNQISADNCR